MRDFWWKILLPSTSTFICENNSKTSPCWISDEQNATVKFPTFEFRCSSVSTIARHFIYNPLTIYHYHHYHQWLYSPLWALSSGTISFQASPSLATVHQFFTPSFFIFSNNPLVQLSLGLPILQLSSDFQSIIILRISSLILSTCPAHLSLDILIDVIMSGDLYS